jgi:hypothetical protein
MALVEQGQEVIPLGASVGLLGDGEFDGTDLQHTLETAWWSYVYHTGCHVTASWAGATFRLDTVGWCIKPGTLVAFPEASMTRDAYGPILLLCCWAKGYQEPLYLVSTMDTAEEACRMYAKRLRIETFFLTRKAVDSICTHRI